MKDAGDRGTEHIANQQGHPEVASSAGLEGLCEEGCEEDCTDWGTLVTNIPRLPEELPLISAGPLHQTSCPFVFLFDFSLLRQRLTQRLFPPARAFLSGVGKGEFSLVR